MVIVVDAIEIGRHDRDKVAAILIAVGIAHFDARYFGNSVRLVGML